MARSMQQNVMIIIIFFLLLNNTSDIIPNGYTKHKLIEQYSSFVLHRRKKLDYSRPRVLND